MINITLFYLVLGIIYCYLPYAIFLDIISLFWNNVWVMDTFLCYLLLFSLYLLVILVGFDCQGAGMFVAAQGTSHLLLVFILP